ncbi:nitrile hydratase [Polaromonas sp. YR568]|uniref:nitrile hydratase subunit beta n=1 Tax=Polaromonas sp. YR568 TaxID=1855301 RepID=UPI0008E0C7E1|nr:nitrile hydratase subunit beta [Polaromonas sp. YR568]SFU61852.1 nitrile hydratase [Polaromonas sp. YR568]
MKLQHHLGGLENLGPVNVETAVFVQPWEKRIFGIHTVMMAESAHLKDALPRYPVQSLPTAFKDDWTWASLRTGAEGMQPFEYFKYRYYEKWLMGISQFFVDRGYVTADELDDRSSFYSRQPEAALPDKPNLALKAQVTRYLKEGDSPLRPLPARPRYQLGQKVKVADPEAVDHTRLPGYLRNQVGTVTLVYPGAYAYFVNTGPDGIGKAMPVYQVVFAGDEIWGAGKCEPNLEIYADLFEAYVGPVERVAQGEAA